MESQEPPSWSQPADAQALLQQRDETNLLLSGFSKIFLPLPNNTPSPHFRRCFSDPCTGYQQLPMTHMMDSFSSSLPKSFQSLPSKCSSSSREDTVEIETVKSLKDQVLEMSQLCDKILQEEVSSRQDDSVQATAMLRRLKDSMMGMIQFCDDILTNQQREEGAAQDEIIHATRNISDVRTLEESVKVEKMGECIAVQFNCPCAKGYQVLISGKNCYYKLM